MDEDDGIIFSHENTAWLEHEVLNGMRLWHVIGIVMFSILCIIVLLCCCFRFRIPRTKQEIEADYQRRKIVKKFRKRIQKFENSEMDAEMDLKKALEKIRGDIAKENHKSSDQSSDSNDESNYDDQRTGAKKKRMLSVPKRDQIQTIYGNDSSEQRPLSLEAGGGV